MYNQTPAEKQDLNRKFSSLTKKQKKMIDYADISCEDDLIGMIEGYYNFNQTKKTKKTGVI
jgi:hypothetical protein